MNIAGTKVNSDLQFKKKKSMCNSHHTSKLVDNGKRLLPEPSSIGLFFPLCGLWGSSDLYILNVRLFHWSILLSILYTIILIQLVFYFTGNLQKQLFTSDWQIIKFNLRLLWTIELHLQLLLVWCKTCNSFQNFSNWVWVSSYFLFFICIYSFFRITPLKFKKVRDSNNIFFFLSQQPHELCLHCLSGIFC